jgi:hypothetical protein
MTGASVLLYFLIVGCEVAFWLVLLLSLVVRYVIRQQTLSKWLLRSLPLIDVLLLGFTALDLRSGTTATFAHGLAAAYIGFTVAFGATVIAWADGHFAHRFAAGPAPKAPPTRGWGAVRFDLALWLRCIVACVITVALLEVMIAFVANDTVTQPLRAWYKHAFGCVFFWFIFGPVWSLFSAHRVGSDT